MPSAPGARPCRGIAGQGSGGCSRGRGGHTHPHRHPRGGLAHERRDRANGRENGAAAADPHPHPRGCANTRAPFPPVGDVCPPPKKKTKHAQTKADSATQGHPPPPPLPPGLCYDHLRPHFVKFQPQLPFVQEHFDPLHTLPGRKGTNHQTPAGRGKIPPGAAGTPITTTTTLPVGNSEGKKARAVGAGARGIPGKIQPLVSLQSRGEGGFKLEPGDAGGAARGTILRASVLPRRGEESRERPEPAPALRSQPEEIYTPPVSDLHPPAPLLQAGVVWGVIPAPLAHSFYSPAPPQPTRAGSGAWYRGCHHGDDTSLHRGVGSTVDTPLLPPTQAKHIVPPLKMGSKHPAKLFGGGFSNIHGDPKTQGKPGNGPCTPTGPPARTPMGGIHGG